MNPSTVSALLKDSPGYGLAALCICAMVVLFVWLMRVQGARLADRDKHITELQSAHQAETNALKLTIPLTQQLAVAVSVLESKNRRRSDPVPPAIAEAVK